MTTPTHRLIQITDDQGDLLNVLDAYEPLPGSVIMTDGEHGTAWQRHFHDGLWHRCGSTQKKNWEYLLTEKRNVVLVYDAAERRVAV